jgi:hypothetical protein
MYLLIRFVVGEAGYGPELTSRDVRCSVDMRSKSGHIADIGFQSRKTQRCPPAGPNLGLATATLLDCRPS